MRTNRTIRRYLQSPSFSFLLRTPPLYQGPWPQNKLEGYNDFGSFLTLTWTAVTVLGLTSSTLFPSHLPVRCFRRLSRPPTSSCQKLPNSFPFMAAVSFRTSRFSRHPPKLPFYAMPCQSRGRGTAPPPYSFAVCGNRNLKKLTPHFEPRGSSFALNSIPESATQQSQLRCSASWLPDPALQVHQTYPLMPFPPKLLAFTPIYLVSD